MKSITFVGIPFYTLAKYQGMSKAVENLRRAGIVQRLEGAGFNVDDIGDVDCPVVEKDAGPPNLKNFELFLEGTRKVKHKLSRHAKSDALTFCLGGECSFIVGSLAALKTVYDGKPGIVWLDAHGDFNTPETTPSGFIGGMPLALACGLGPRLTPEVEAQRPLLEPSRVVHIGSRSLDNGEEENPLKQTTVYDAKTVKQRGARRIAQAAAEQLADKADWIIAHLDVDVLDPNSIPAVNFPEPGGLTPNEVTEIFHDLQGTGKLCVVDLTAYNPAKDIDNRARSALLEMVPRFVSGKLKPALRIDLDH